MDEKLALRSPLKEINNRRNNNSFSEKQCPAKKRRRKNVLIMNSDNENSLLGHVKNDSSSNENVNEMLKENQQLNKIREFTNPLPVNFSEPSEYLVLKANKFFTEDLRCPEFSPFSHMRYSCCSPSSCEHENHKVNAEQISEVPEKSLTFLAKSWYMLKYPLTSILKEDTYLSPFVLRFLFFGILDEKDENISLKIKDFIKVHLKIHPPCNKKLRNLYYNTLVGDVDNLDPSNPEIITYNFRTILSLIEKVFNELRSNKPESVEKETLESNNCFEFPKNVDEFYEFLSDNYKKTGNILPSALLGFDENFEEDNDEINSEGLLQRLFMVFSVMVDILEENFRMWWMRSRYCLREKLHSNCSFPIIAEVVWDQTEERGLLNEHCKRVFNIFKSCPSEFKPYKIEISRYITLLSEAVRASEENPLRKFPFFSENCNRFAKELSACIKGDTVNAETVSHVQLIHPPWLKFKVCGYILGNELTFGGLEDLNSVLKILQRNLSLRPKAVVNKNGEPIEKMSKTSNTKHNKTDSSGETIIHKHCRTNNFKALSSILRNKQVNVNISDNVGWTPLHNAAMYNSIDCLKVLINQRLAPSEEFDELDIFALNSDNDSPLSCAVREGNEDVVKILLNNGAGVTVWNIVSKGLSSVDHAETKHMKDILIKGWTKSTSSYRNLNMTPEEINLLYDMLSSYCKVYHIGECCKELEPKYCKNDSYYEFDYVQFLKDEKTLVNFYEVVEKLCTSRSNPKNLKNMLFYLKCKVN